MAGHRKGKMGPGRYPRNASRVFIKLIESAMDNARQHFEDIEAEEMQITHVAAHRGEIARNMRPRARGRATASNHYKVNIELFLEHDEVVDDEEDGDF
jgi:large subunit ribosomal protein L22